MGKPFQTKEFRALKKQWYQTLKDDKEYIDIEDDYGRLVDHRSISDLYQRIHFKMGIMELTSAYYSWACEMIHVGAFTNNRDLMIWEFHIEGLSGAEISEKVGLERTWVNKEIKRIRKYLEIASKP